MIDPIFSKVLNVCNPHIVVLCEQHSCKNFPCAQRSKTASKRYLMSNAYNKYELQNAFLFSSLMCWNLFQALMRSACLLWGEKFHKECQANMLLQSIHTLPHTQSQKTEDGYHFMGHVLEWQHALLHCWYVLYTSKVWERCAGYFKLHNIAFIFRF